MAERGTGKNIVEQTREEVGSMRRWGNIFNPAQSRASPRCRGSPPGCMRQPEQWRRLQHRDPEKVLPLY